jgi:hypothetical protein
LFMFRWRFLLESTPRETNHTGTLHKNRAATISCLIHVSMIFRTHQFSLYLTRISIILNTWFSTKIFPDIANIL